MPERTCLGCRAVRDKAGLVRLVLLDGSLKPDCKGSLPGRGAYVCPERGCVEEALRKKDAFPRALKSKVILPGAEELWGMIEACKDGRKGPKT